MKILLAEDTKDLNRAVSAILGHEGYEVTSVFDGEEAMEALKSDSFDGIVLDIMMPKKGRAERAEGNPGAAYPDSGDAVDREGGGG